MHEHILGCKVFIRESTSTNISQNYKGSLFDLEDLTDNDILHAWW